MNNLNFSQTSVLITKFILIFKKFVLTLKDSDIFLRHLTLHKSCHFIGISFLSLKSRNKPFVFLPAKIHTFNILKTFK